MLTPGGGSMLQQGNWYHHVLEAIFPLLHPAVRKIDRTQNRPLRTYCWRIHQAETRSQGHKSLEVSVLDRRRDRLTVKDKAVGISRLGP